MQEAAWALPLPELSAGRRIAVRIAMIAITTSSSTRVKPPRLEVHPSLPADLLRADGREPV
jgi:hypothetical protein